MKKRMIQLISVTALVVAATAFYSMQIKTPANVDIMSEDYVPLGQMPNYENETSPAKESISEIIPMTTAPFALAKTPSADKEIEYKNNKAVIDASNTKDGYVMAAFTAKTGKAIKIIVTGPSGTKYTYNLKNDGTYETFPLSDGNGKYNVGIFENVEGTKYAQSLSQNIDVSLVNEFAPFLLSNQYVNYTDNSNVVKLAKQITEGKKTDIEKITAVYNYVVTNLTYDDHRAATVKSGYLPVIDSVLKEKKGICFDYSAVMTAMLRSQEIPCKLVVGYAGTTYHAWISAYTKENGWIEQVILFDGKSWKLMDPTFASGSKNDAKILEFIRNENNYSTKYLY